MSQKRAVVFPVSGKEILNIFTKRPINSFRMHYVCLNLIVGTYRIIGIRCWI